MKAKSFQDFDYNRRQAVVARLSSNTRPSLVQVVWAWLVRQGGGR